MKGSSWDGGDHDPIRPRSIPDRPLATAETLDGYLRNGQVVDAHGAPVGHTIKVRASEGYGPMARTYVAVRWAGTLFTGSIPNGSDHVTLKAVSPDFQSSLLREYVERAS